jgi:hypothetical protein
MSSGSWLRGVIVSAIAIGVLFVAVLLAGADIFPDNSSSNTSPAPIHGTGATASTCWPVKLDDNTGNRVLSAGVPKQYQSSAQGTVNYLLKVAHQDPRALQALWNTTPAGEKHPVRDWHSLVDTTGKCYSELGQQVWRETATQLRLGKVHKSVAPSHGCNTYVTPRGNAGCVVESISGNRHGVKITFSNGKSVWVMFRCGNPVTKAPPPGNVPPRVHHRVPPHHHVPPHHGPPHRCVPPHAPNGYKVNPKTCKLYKPKQSFQCMQNGGPGCPPNHVIQPVQHEGPGQEQAHKPTPGAPAQAPTPNPIGPKPQSGSPAPSPNDTGYNSGANDGSGTPGGSACDSTSCSGGGATPGSGPTDTTNSGNNNGTDGSGNSTGNGTVTNPFG